MVAPPSPVTAEEIASMTVEGIVAALDSWAAVADAARELQVAVALDPDRICARARLFRGAAPGYLIALLAGLRDALHADRGFAWQPVLDLCTWAVDQEAEKRQPAGRGDRPWRSGS